MVKSSHNGRVKNIIRSLVDPLRNAPVRARGNRRPQTEGAARGGAHEHPRAALMGDEQLVEYAAVLTRDLPAAGAAALAPALLRRLQASEAALRRTHQIASKASAANQALEPAAVWLLENFYLLQGEWAEARAGLMEQRRQRWLLVQAPDGQILPRLLVLLRELVAHADGRVTLPLLRKFLLACQQMLPFTLAELWSVPLMLRLAIFEYLQPIAIAIEARWRDTGHAVDLAEALLAAARDQPARLAQTLAAAAEQSQVASAAWVAGFYRRIQSEPVQLRLAHVWLEQQLGTQQQSIEQILARLSSAQTLAQCSASQCIDALRRMERSNWQVFVDALSTVEATLQRDPAGVYGRMDAVTRNRYRDAVAFCAAHAGVAEQAVAELVLKLAADASTQAGPGAGDDGSVAAAHVGHWLIGRGRRQAERQLRVRRSPRQLLWHVLRRHPSWLYFVPIAAITITGVLLSAPEILSLGWAYMPLVALVVAVAVSEPGVALINWAATRDIVPHPLPRLDFSTGIPARWRTLVAVPCMLGSAAEVDELVRDLEIRCMGNRDANVFFALLADFIDAPQAVMPGDADLLARAVAGIEALNARHAAGDVPRFALFCRDRVHNASDDIWMGWERKRGKLMALGRFLRGRKTADLHLCVGDAAALRSVAFVITLDADTELPPAAARRLVATMAHPLNRPVRDERRRRIVAGYAVLQPRVSVGASRPQASRLAHLFSEDIVLDPYTGLVSNSEQDLYGETSYIGKGIYDVDAFAWATDGRFPQQRVLSHDLLEGSYARTGFASDIELFEHYPDSYRADMQRRHRWTRGDWQIAAWLLPRVPDADGRRVRNALSLHHRLKLLDNLRRSLVPAALLLILCNAWLVGHHPVYWTAFVVVVVFAPTLLALSQRVMARNRRTPWRLHWRLCGAAAGRMLGQAVLRLVMLPFEAFHWLDAIARSAWRVLVSKKKRLQWAPAGTVARRAQDDVADCYRVMATAPAVALATGMALFLQARDATTWALAAPLLLAWAAAPLIAWWLSQPAPAELDEPLAAADRAWLQAVARRTWHFFDAQVGAATQGLPPDNLQEYPHEMVAHRTSPTNIGMYLCALWSALDFGWITRAEAHERMAGALDTLERMERFKGHLLNWYDTGNLAPLTPRYVSTVDSGNFLVSLIVVARALEEAPQAPWFPASIWPGLDGTWQVAREVLAADWPESEAHAAVLAITAVLDRPPPATAPLGIQCRQLQALARHVRAVIAALPDACPPQTRDWLQRLLDQCGAWLQQMVTGLPWLTAPGGAALDGEAAALFKALDANPSRLEAAGVLRQALHAVGAAHPLAGALEQAARAVQGDLDRAQALAMRCRALCDADFDFLYDPEQKLMAIGYNVALERLDEGRYDLLASEARLASFVAIAQGRLPLAHWLALGRRLTASAEGAALVSWSGTMFEYLMPLLFMPAFGNTLLTRTCRNVIAEQIRYGSEQGIPWGISESAYNATDAQFAYQYRAFGVPGLGLRRGLARDKVVAPYATALALVLRPQAAVRNLRALAGRGALGRYGFYEALDFTPARRPENAPFALVRSFMAHHQGMSLMALSALLNGAPMQRRFEREPMFRAHEILLQEKVPATVQIDAGVLHAEELRAAAHQLPPAAREIDRLDTPVPQVQLLSNGRWHVFVSQAGSGLSQWQDLAVNRWDQDGTRDAGGIFCYIQDLDDGRLWSGTAQPTGVPADQYRATFAQGSAQFRRVDGDIETQTRVAVSPEDDVELRRVTVTNHSRRHRRIALTTYVELALLPHAGVLAHPAFDKLFLQTEYVAASQAIIATRRPRAADEHPPFFFHLMSGRETAQGDFSYETRRDVFIGRAGSLATPAALQGGQALASSNEASLDAMASVRREFALAPGQACTVDIVTGAAAQRDSALALAARYADGHLAARVLDLAWTHAQVLAYQLDISAGDRQLFAQLASAALFMGAEARARMRSAAPLALSQSTLWKHGISGDLPLVVVHIGAENELPLARQAVQMHRYWRLHGLAADLLFWIDGGAGYRQDLRDHVMARITSTDADQLDRQGGVFVRQASQLQADDRVSLLAHACLVLDGRDGALASQWPARKEPAPPSAGPGRAVIATALQPAAFTHELVRPADWQAFNGLGGWNADASEYRIWLERGRDTPQPWVNVLANPCFGSVVGASGSATTWSQNAHEFRLTPWRNDPVTDDSEEAFYLRDDASGDFWSPTPLPVRGPSPYVCAHGFGYTRFETIQADIASTLTTFVAREAPVKLSVLRLKNHARHARRLSIFAYVGWVLGEHRARSAPHVMTRLDAAHRVILASNPFNDAFAATVAWFAVGQDGQSRSLPDSGRKGPETISATASRANFIGRNQSLRHPRALSRSRLDGASGPAADPCAAWQLVVELAPQAECELVFALGAAPDPERARSDARQWTSPRAARAELARVRALWQDELGRLTVQTPDAGMNRLMNGWLPYQVISSRLWGRSGFWQSGGAFGFRDQLQDSVALLSIDPARARAQILHCAAHQFEAGDVLHWWHPPLQRGVRTRSSDDLLWLPWAVCEYVQGTGDAALLDVDVPFLQGRALAPGEMAHYDLFSATGPAASIHAHCTRAIDHALRLGANGLPLMGGGDWNDGMDRVGHRGRGESVWLAFFLIHVLRRFAPLAAQRGDAAQAARYASQADQLVQAVEARAWDGQWYLRAFNDDGVPIGSAGGAECQIDSLPQSWAVLSGAADPQRQQQAVQAAVQRLVHADDRVIQLFDPPFDRGTLDPGYIQGYLPGTRENGGQYTHAAIWLGMALARLGRRDAAWQLFDFINPASHSATPQQVQTWQVEPYVVAADVYWNRAHRGRGGWTWYTGSAGWLYRFGLQSILGLQRRGERLRIQPGMPSHWPAWRATWRLGGATYHFECRAQAPATGAIAWSIVFDGKRLAGLDMPFVDDGQTHHICIQADDSRAENQGAAKPDPVPLKQTPRGPSS